MDTKTRAFIAIEVPSELSKPIAELQSLLKKSDAGANWVPAENFHYNLKFFGYLSDSEMKKVIFETRAAVSAAKSFEIEIQDIGAFPSMASPRVIWLGMKKGTAEIKSLAGSLEKAYSRIGIPSEGREFQAHLTLCRLKSNEHKNELMEKVKQKQHINIGSFKVTELVLFKSTLMSGGPVYEPIEKFKLG
ncbi:MAG: RNA 2',3'-cyclic phosphodiesterase [Candidatus Nanoarchaeia archaeon]|nr:RNA 2',3'-cyclic phosphodiesterase [Candidatus Nanoarchaeia archaeon]MDD5239301.1 RNA 2',3'-cyclic phosphodiesterase [Candidatus Nanoarchaeia archaeon]